MALPVVNISIDYEAEKDKIGGFLSEFAGKDLENGLADLGLDDNQATTRTRGMKYMDQLHEKTVTELVSRIRYNTRRYVQLFSEVVDKLMPLPTKDISEHDEVIDVILHQRRERNERMEGMQEGFPDHLLRR
ncbi:hypothetical protein PHLCEN_2v7804 [Hermanssonia centrifuga]|uniref:Uncharacterized protein n=1 Tax=Hermanssonia centrifuga TaxID=98765 RepID=A0A2R6NVK3_9APHY|nr:hypothetical protein PHLCEN_2v7804 [Hermanssonia centrifuga]